MTFKASLPLFVGDPVPRGRKREIKMTDKELRNLNRKDLMQLLLDQGREMQSLREQLAAANAALKDRSITLSNAGSIAEAALQLNGVFDAAQAACLQYTENIRDLSQRQEKLCAKMLADAQAQADAIVDEAQKQAALLQRDAQTQYDAMVKQAKTDSQAYWDDVSAKMERYTAAHAELRQLLAAAPVEGGRSQGL